MKNIFKIMGLALIAGSLMFTACKKDETDTNTNNDTNQEEQQPTQGTYSLVFDGTAIANQAYSNAMTAEQQGQTMWLFECAKSRSGNSLALPYFSELLVGASTTDMQINSLYTELYLNDVIEDEDGNQYGDWQYDESTTFEFTKVDLNKHMLSCAQTLKMWDYASYTDAVDNGTDEDAAYEAAERKNLVFNMTNYIFTVAQE